MWNQGTGTEYEMRLAVWRGIRNRIVATLAVAVGGVVGLLYYAAFWATHFAWYQSLAIILSTLLVVPTIIIGMWVVWGLGVHRRYWHHASGEIIDTW